MRLHTRDEFCRVSLLQLESAFEIHMLLPLGAVSEWSVHEKLHPKRTRSTPCIAVYARWQVLAGGAAAGAKSSWGRIARRCVVGLAGKLERYRS